jgi:hypothetical protein
MPGVQAKLRCGADLPLAMSNVQQQVQQPGRLLPNARNRYGPHRQPK